MARGRSRVTRKAAALLPVALLWVALFWGGSVPLGGTAQAQDVQAFGELYAALDAAQDGRQKSAADALSHLDAADAAYARLAPTLQDDQLRSALETTLQRSKAALGGASQALAVQTDYAQALLRRALYDQTLGDLARAGGAADADVRRRLEVLAQAFGLDRASESALLADAEAGRVAAVAGRLQAQAAQKVVAYLEPVVQGALPAASPRGYVRVGNASGWHLVLQGARGVTDQATDFRLVLELLAKGRGEQARPKLAELFASAQATQQALQQAQSSPPPSPPVAETEQATQAGGIAPEPKPEAEQPEAEQQEAEQQTAVVVGIGESPASGAAGVGAPLDAPPTLQTVDSEGNEVALPAAEQALDGVYAAMGRALADTLVHDTEGARAELKLAAAGLAVADLPDSAGSTNQARREQCSRLLALAEQPSLGTGDVGLQLVALRALEHPDSVQIGLLASIWSSSLQLAAFLSLALVAPIPLRLALRAMGRQNPKWNMVVIGIGLLLLPLVLEGMAVLGLWLGDISGIEALNSLGWLGIRRSPVGQIAWWLLSLAGMLLISLGFRGLSAPSGRLAAARRDWDASRHTEVTTVISDDVLNPPNAGVGTGAGLSGVRRTAVAARQRAASSGNHAAGSGSGAEVESGAGGVSQSAAAQATRTQLPRIVRPKFDTQPQSQKKAQETIPPPMQSTAERQAALERLAGRLGNDRLRRIAARQTQDKSKPK